MMTYRNAGVNQESEGLNTYHDLPRRCNTPTGLDENLKLYRTAQKVSRPVKLRTSRGSSSIKRELGFQCQDL